MLKLSVPCKYELCNLPNKSYKALKWQIWKYELGSMESHKYDVVTFSSYSIAICCISADCIPIMEPSTDDDNVTCDETFKHLYKVHIQ